MVRDILKYSSNLFNEQGPAELWMEVSRHHPAMIKDWLHSNQEIKFDLVEIIKDLSGNPRFVRLKAKIPR